MRQLPILLRMMRRRRSGPPAPHDVVWEPGLRVPAPGGVDLITDHYAPAGAGPGPSVVIRSPYGRGFPWNHLFGVRLAEQGFHVVLQSTRGTGGSGGVFHFWRNERDDGRATVAWLRRQAWFDGTFGTAGPSYFGYAQWMLAGDPPPEWRAAVIQVAPYQAYENFWGRGAFALELGLIGGTALFDQSLGAVGYARAMLRLALRLREVARSVPLIDSYQRAFDGRRQHFEDWLTHPDRDDPYWSGNDAGATAETLDVPVSLTTGWHDLALDQTLVQYARLRRAGRTPPLLIGPWTHTSPFDEGWAEVFPAMLRHLRGEVPELPVRVHVGGADEWRDLPDWPPPSAPSVWHLGDGTLTRHPGAGSSTFRYDPHDPTPSIGGRVQDRTAGAVDNRRLESRADVLTFTSAALTEPLEVAGPVCADLAVTTTAASADLFVRLCDVDPHGRSVNVCDGLTRFGTDGRVRVDMSHTAHRFRAGHRIRLQISGGAHPRFTRNYGTGEPVATATRMVPAQTTVHHRSGLHLPVV